MPRLPKPTLAQQQPAPADLGTVVSLLRAEYSPQPAALRRVTEPLDAVIRIILAQQNTSVVASRQYAALRRNYPQWEMALLDGPDGLEDTLRQAGGGLSRIKADYIYQLLYRLDERYGALSLQFVGGLDTPQARAVLESLPGIGMKTASLLLLFDLGRPAMPVENNIQRVLQRLDWVPVNWGLNKSERWLAEVLPQDWAYLYHFHLAFIRHGRQICLPQRPLCRRCIIQKFCPSAALFLPDGSGKG